MADLFGEGPHTAILSVWLPAFFFAHVFSGYWLFRAMRLLVNPGWLSWCSRRPATRTSGGASGSSAQTSGHSDAAHRAACARATSLDSRVLAEVAEATEVVLTPRAGGAMAAEHYYRPTPLAAAGARLNSSSGGGGRVSGASSRHSVVEIATTDLEWRKLSCSYRTNTGTKHVLEDVYGAALPGEMQALLGPSGAGKSTLMDMLAQRKSTGRLSGMLLVNGRPPRRDFVRLCAYVPQYDNFVPVMTALEVMQFYAGIILPRDWTRVRRATRVEEVLRDMGLSHAQKTLVGGQSPGGLLLRGLSGGERKRLSIATGILAAPSVVFLDEPTTGLDSFAALTVMGYLKRMARDSGHVVIASIHQPRSAIWLMFDTVTLLSCGRLMYHGARDGMVDWFAGLGYEYDASRHGVVSDWALDLVACGSHKPAKFYGPNTITTREQVRAASARFVAQWIDVRGLTARDLAIASSGGNWGGSPTVGSRLWRLITCRCGSDKADKDAAALVPATSLGSAGSASRRAGRVGSFESEGGASGGAVAEAVPSSWWQQFRWILRRELIMITRNPADVAGRTITFAYVAAFAGLLYYGLPTNGPGPRLRFNMLLNIIAFYLLVPYISMSLYTADKKTYLADISAKLFRPSAYYMAKVVGTLPFHVVSSLVLNLIIYGMAGLRNDPIAIAQNCSISLLMALIAVQVMHACAVIAPTQDMAFMYSIAWTTIQLLFNNFAITFKEISLPWLSAIKWLSAAYYAFEGLSIVEFQGLKVPCQGGGDPQGLEFLKKLLPNSKILNSNAVLRQLGNPGADCIIDAAPVLTYFEFSRDFVACFGILVCYWGITHVLTYLALRSIAQKERR